MSWFIKTMKDIFNKMPGERLTWWQWCLGVGLLLVVGYWGTFAGTYFMMAVFHGINSNGWAITTLILLLVGAFFGMIFHVLQKLYPED